MSDTQADLTEQDERLLADLYRRRADVYSPKRERNPYYGDDDIDLLLRVAQSEREAAAEARRALEESVKLQSHYARLLNYHDGGKRMTFASADEWIARLGALASPPAPQEG